MPSGDGQMFTVCTNGRVRWKIMARLNFVPRDYGLRCEKRRDYGLARFRARRFQVVAIGDENMPQITG